MLKTNDNGGVRIFFACGGPKRKRRRSRFTFGGIREHEEEEKRRINPGSPGNDVRLRFSPN
jgi:hypothetical protein